MICALVAELIVVLAAGAIGYVVEETVVFLYESWEAIQDLEALIAHWLYRP